MATLLESITAAASSAATATNPPKSDEIGSQQTSLKPASGFKIPELDSKLNELLRSLCLDLKSKLGNLNNVRRDEFISLINSFFKNCSSQLQVPVSSKLNLDFLIDAFEKLGALISREVAGLIAEGCVHFEMWDVMKIIIEKNMIGNLNSFNLIEKLAEKNQTELICLCATKISNLRASEVFAMLRYFISPSEKSYDSMMKIRKEWEEEAVLAIDNYNDVSLSKKSRNLAKDSAILLMMANDGFYSNEICLHYVFSSKSFSGIILSSAVSKLDGFETLNLVKYFVKWMEKYERFIQAKPCVAAGIVLGLSKCDIIPTMEDVWKGLKLVLDEHFSYLVLNKEFHDELKKVMSVVEGNETTPSSSCCSQLSSVVSSEPQCLCMVLNGGASQLGITINQTQAMALPGACKVQTPPASKCNSNGGSPSSSPTTPSSNTPSTPDVPSGGSGSKTTPGGGVDSSSSSVGSFSRFQLGFPFCFQAFLIQHCSKDLRCFGGSSWDDCAFSVIKHGESSGKFCDQFTDLFNSHKRLPNSSNQKNREIILTIESEPLRSQSEQVGPEPEVQHTQSEPPENQYEQVDIQ